MTAAGWVFMLSSVAFVTGLVIFCFYRVLTIPNAAEHLRGPLNIDPGDRDD